MFIHFKLLLQLEFFGFLINMFDFSQHVERDLCVNLNGATNRIIIIIL